ncbi:MAG: universal stress protein, partial [Flavobacteriaceae bacterium]|nr:universal stress protein [Flavobacteriaceae bacterium]
TLKEIVFPTDFNILFRNNVLNTISDILKNYKSRLNILNISKKEKPLTSLQKINKESLEDSLNEEQLEFHFISNKNIENALQLFVENREVDMIAIVAKNLNFSQRILFRPKVARISYHTEIPFLILHE